MSEDKVDRNWYRYPTARVDEVETVAPGVRGH